MDGKHTPGPWRIVKAVHGPIDVIDARGRDIVTIYGGGVEAESKEANARLIAAAPDLLDALHDTAVALAAILAQPQDETRRPHAQHYLERAREVLAKAGGGA